MLSRPFFVVGFPRSGTTLLQAMLMQAEGVFIPPETQFLPLLRRRYRIDAESDDQAFEFTLSIIHRVCERNELPVDRSTLETELRASERSVLALFRTLLEHIQRRAGCTRLGEKSPNHLLWGAELLEHFPDSKMINIIRDGRDAATSSLDSLDREYGLLASAFRWRHYQRVHERLASSQPADRYTSVKYEDLVDDPEPVLRRLCSFLELEFSPAMLRPQDRKHTGFASREKHKLRTLQPVTGSRVGRFRAAMSEADIAAFQFVAGRELERLGYKRDDVSRLRGILKILALAPGVVWRRLLWRRSVRRRSRPPRLDKPAS